MRSWVIRQLSVLFVVASVIGAPAAHADTIQLRLFDGTNTVTISDGQAGVDANPVAGAITWIGTLGDWTINVSTAVGSAVLGPASMDLNSINTAPGGTSTTLSISFTQFEMTTPVSTFSMEFGGTSTNASAVVYQAWADDANNPFGLSQLIGTVDGGAISPFSGTSGGGVAVSGSYSLTQQIRVTGIGVGEGKLTSFSGDAELNGTVPEPTTAVLLGIGLAGVALWSRRKKSRTQA